MSSRKHEADMMRALAGRRAMEPMSAALLDLREQGFHDLADELTALRDDWARTVSHHAGKHARGVVECPLKPLVKAPRPRVQAPKPALRVVARDEQPGGDSA